MMISNPLSSSSPATTPAIVAQEAVRRLPRWALLWVTVSYVLAGFIGRAPWKSVDIAAFGVMHSLAEGKTSWWKPEVLGQLDAPALLPYWLGAWSIQLLGGLFGPEVASRIPFGMALGLAFASTWYGVYYLARMKAAQPVPFAFGGEANPTDYARSLADGGLLAMVAMLGLAQLSHETSIQVVQLGCAALLFYAVAASTIHVGKPLWVLCLASLGLALSGVPAFGLGLALAAATARLLHGDIHARWWAVGIVGAGAVSAGLAWQLGLWRAHWGVIPANASDWRSLAQLWIWFSWPAWPLTLVALWRWHKWWRSMHIAWPAAFLGVIMVVTITRPGADRSLMLAAPAFATLAAMALPTLHRSVSALVDWFTLIFFSVCGFAIWVVYVAMHTGAPAKPAANVRRLLPGFEPHFETWHLVVAIIITLAWLGVIAWRTGKHRSALWRCLVLDFADDPVDAFAGLCA
jgi:hypothetical protein